MRWCLCQAQPCWQERATVKRSATLPFWFSLRFALACVSVGLIGASPMPPAQVPPLIGVNAHPLQNAYAIYPPSQVLDSVAAVGASVVRVDVPWDWLEWTAPGVEGWDSEE